MIQFVEKDFEGVVTRSVTLEEDAILLVEAQKALEPKYHVTKEAMLALVNAFDKSPNVPITLANVLKTVEDHHEVLGFVEKSANEMEYEKLSAQLGPDQTALVTKLLANHGLYSTNSGEDGFANFTLLVKFAQSNGWSITPDSFHRLIGNFRNTPQGYHLRYAPTPEERSRQKELERKMLEPTKKIERNEDELLRYDEMGNPIHRFVSRWGSSHKPETVQVGEAPNDQAYWQRRTQDAIAALRSNINRVEATEKFGQGLYANWELTFRLFEDWRDQGRKQ